MSGEGSNLQALLDSGLPVVAVASSRHGARALERAESAGVVAAAFPLDAYRSRAARDETMADWLEEKGVEREGRSYDSGGLGPFERPRAVSARRDRDDGET